MIGQVAAHLSLVIKKENQEGKHTVPLGLNVKHLSTNLVIPYQNLVKFVSTIIVNHCHFHQILVTKISQTNPKFLTPRKKLNLVKIQDRY